MKRLLKKNQIIITTLAIMIAIAGYLNYSGRIFGEKDSKETNGNLASQELLDISDEGMETAGDIESQDNEVADGSGTYEWCCGRGKGDKRTGTCQE